MLYYTYNSQDERRNLGGLHLQKYNFVGCQLKLKNWSNVSLYIKNADVFYQEYSDIFNYGIYNNLEKGVVDIFDINYHSYDLFDLIINKIKNKKLREYETLIQ